jgi:type IV secretory pathway VirB3-like protein
MLGALKALGSRPYTLAAVVFCAILLIPACLHKRADLVGVYIPAAQRLTTGEDLYQHAYLYPPFHAWVLLPLVHLPPLEARFIWFALNALAALILIWSAWKLSGGRRLEGTPGPAWQEHLIFGVGLLCSFSYVLDGFTNQLSDLIVAALVIVACRALLSRRDGVAGGLLGLAAALKCTPLLWTGYLIWRQRWLAAVLVVVFAIGADLIPDLTHPPDLPTSRLENWGRRFLLPMADRGHDFGAWACGVNGNHSLGGVTNRWMTYDYCWQDGDMTVFPRHQRVDPLVQKAVALGSMLFCVLVALICSWKWRNRPNLPAHRPDIAGVPPEALEFSLVLILMVLLSPQSSKPHFCILLLPAFCLARIAVVQRSRLLLALLSAAAACGLIANKDLVGEQIYDWVLWHGLITLATLLLFAGCSWTLLRSRRAAPAMASEVPTIRHAA